MFRHADLATIGRAAAVADIKGLRLSGLVAWLIWLFVHLWYLVGFENRLLVFIQWFGSFATHGCGARLITEPAASAARGDQAAQAAARREQPLAGDPGHEVQGRP